MPKKRFSAEQIVALLRQIEFATAQGKSISIACQEAGITCTHLPRVIARLYWTAIKVSGDILTNHAFLI